MGGRDWPPRRHGGPERIRGFAQQVETSLYLLRFFPSFCSPPARSRSQRRRGVGAFVAGLSRRRRRRSRLPFRPLCLPSVVSQVHAVH